jgi:hypothetical protein
MRPDDREYFLLRAHQEHEAAARSTGPARGRHEELASSYRMRVMYLDRPDAKPERLETTEPVMPAMIVPAT